MGAANEFRLAFIDALDRRAGRDPALAGFVEGLSGARCLEHADGAGSVPGHAAGFLRNACDGLACDGLACDGLACDGLACDAPLAGAIRAFAAVARWYCILEGAAVDPALVAGMLVGRPDLPPDAGMRLGLFLIGPHVHYPLHQHPAAEVYFVASGRLEIRHGLTGAPFVLDPGEYSVTPCNRVHALQTRGDACLIAYVWTGRITEPAWWWAEDEDGWHRTRWERAESGRWHRHSTEPVTRASLAEAGESA